MSEIVRAGHSADRAIDLIYRAIGSSLSVTKIIKKVIVDNKIWRASCIENCGWVVYKFIVTVAG